MLKRASAILARAGLDSPIFESEVLLRHILKCTRAEFYSSLNSTISSREEKSLAEFIDRRLQGEPVSYITGKKEFYNLSLCVDRHVLIPRPETEMLVDEGLYLLQTIKEPVVCDLCTGSGAIAIALASNHPSVRIYATDISSQCLAIARANCSKYGLTDRVQLLESDLLSALPEPVDLILTNPPYVKQSDLAGLPFEPVLALDGGEDGLEVIRRLSSQFTGHLKPGGYLLMEIGYGQSEAVSRLLRNDNPPATINIKNDLAGIPRLVIVQLDTKAKTQNN
jgi:release factor glutamine methyltransferase